MSRALRLSTPQQRQLHCIQLSIKEHQRRTPPRRFLGLQTAQLYQHVFYQLCAFPIQVSFETVCRKYHNFWHLKHDSWYALTGKGKGVIIPVRQKRRTESSLKWREGHKTARKCTAVSAISSFVAKLWGPGSGKREVVGLGTLQKLFPFTVDQSTVINYLNFQSLTNKLNTTESHVSFEHLLALTLLAELILLTALQATVLTMKKASSAAVVTGDRRLKIQIGL